MGHLSDSTLPVDLPSLFTNSQFMHATKFAFVYITLSDLELIHYSMYGANTVLGRMFYQVGNGGDRRGAMAFPCHQNLNWRMEKGIISPKKKKRLTSYSSHNLNER